MSARRIAVVGSGVAGLTAAYLLSRGGDAATLFEADSRLGGHADTHTVPGPGGHELAVDTGFIVHNRRTYPLLTRLFGELGVAVQPAEMSMSVRCAGCGLGYAGQRGLGGLLAGLPAGRGRYLRMLTEVTRFHRAARRLLAAGDDQVTLGGFLDRGGFSGYFTAHFAIPFVAAVWSCPPQATLAYPARYLFAFLAQHGLLSVTGSPRWLTVRGGSRVYVHRIAALLAEVRIGAPVHTVRRLAGGGVEIEAGAQPVRRFDAVVIATHPDQALRMLADPTPEEKEVLGAFRYTANPAVLHTDASLLPSRRRVRASWNYRLGSCAAVAGQVQVSYDLNRLQRLPAGADHILTLNPGQQVAPGRVLARRDYAHPSYTRESVAAQARLPGLNSAVTGYAGAYHGWGFHEDGCRSGVAAARALGSTW